MNDIQIKSPEWRKWAEGHVQHLREDREKAIEQRRALLAGEVHTYRGSGAGMVDDSLETVKLYERSITMLDEAIAGYQADLAGNSLVV